MLLILGSATNLEELILFDDFWINEDGFERVEPIDGYWDRLGAEPVDDPGISEEVI